MRCFFATPILQFLTLSANLKAQRVRLKLETIGEMLTNIRVFESPPMKVNKKKEWNFKTNSTWKKIILITEVVLQGESQFWVSVWNMLFLISYKGKLKELKFKNYSILISNST